MKRTLLVSLLVGGLVFAVGQRTTADIVDFVVSADLPAATGVSIVATEVDADTETFGSEVTELDFSPLSFDSEFGIWRSGVFFAIDVGATGGAGAPDVEITFGDESNPVGQAKGLGDKATIGFTLVTGGPDPEDQEEAELTDHGPVKLLSQISGGEPFDETDIEGGFLRARVGIYDGSDTDLNGAGGEPFTNADVPGAYTGTLTVEATVD